ncbi:hypothetical protein CO038_03255 [Candidatus Pacearchaeota archaeon CG_4_9_14_0_2_um_filter_39_13]|nr:MAG: hypothetical protein CO038_03255 [Candidatus Pacearchaeota archaeon CG_4_9_14_0_2_um_filter_39_13]
MKKWVIAAVVIVIVLAIAGLFFINHESDYESTDYSEGQLNDEGKNLIFGENGQDEENSGDKRLESNGNENCPLVFTEYLVDPKYLQKVGQIGVVHGSGKYIVERSYISIKQEFWEQKIPLYAPTDMVLRSGSRYNINNDKYLDDYALDFDAGCGIQVSLGHVKEVVPVVAEKLPEAKGDSRTQSLGDIKFEAGELIGYYVQQRGEGAVAGFDFITRDAGFENTFTNQERYQDRSSQNLLHGVCPYDFYTGEKKEAYYNLLGSAGGKLFEVKDCGSASRDVPGSISGMWFLEKEIKGYPFEEEGYKDGDYGSTLPISADEEAVTIGNLGPSKTSRVYSDNPSYKLPEEVTEEHCYQFLQGLENQGYVYFKVVDEMSMDVYYSSSGACPAEFPSSGAKRYWK